VSRETFVLIANFQILFFAIGAVLAFAQFKVRRFYIKLLGFTLIASVLGDLSSYALRSFGVRVNYGASVYYILVFPLISLLYFHSLRKRNAWFFITISILYVLFGLVNLSFIQQSDINSYTLILMSVIVIIYSLYYFYWLLREIPTSQLQRLPMFWVNSAYIIFFSVNLFLFVFTSHLVHVLNNNLLVYWTLHNVLGIIEGLMIIVALWMDLRNIKSHS
jgi:hypothetical protein